MNEIGNVNNLKGCVKINEYMEVYDENLDFEHKVIIKYINYLSVKNRFN